MNNKKFKNKVLITLGLIVGFIFAVGIQTNVSAIEKGDIIYTGGQTGWPLGWINELALGHTAIFTGFEEKNGRTVFQIVDSVPNYFKYGGIRKATLRRFTRNFSYPYYGNRTTKQRPTKKQREQIVAMVLSKVGGDYNFSHMSPKGPDSYDCVGISEAAYESVGLNPTPDELESGWGWPFTPAEQFENTVANQPFIFPAPPSLQTNHNVTPTDTSFNSIASQLFNIKQNSLNDIEIDSNIIPSIEN
ncbi:MAG: hypothetical protein KAR84_01080 [Elusimicrobiales bacterium]|nr:hypothetical protein [Elusimicrobiales bacterium]MCK5584102.1 hypothetical protein [Elusimicrobiales bacterium]